MVWSKKYKKEFFYHPKAMLGKVQAVLVAKEFFGHQGQPDHTRGAACNHSPCTGINRKDA